MPSRTGKAVDAWSSFLTKVEAAVNEVQAKGDGIPYFRGHGDSKWSLVPSLGRKSHPPQTESVLYHDFRTHAGTLLPAGNSSWETLFAMRHHAVPTRLLDWTETFSVALYFAVKNFSGRADIWVLNAPELNYVSCDRRAIQYPETNFEHDYYYYFIDKLDKFIGEVVAIRPAKSYLRVSAQKGIFTVHDNLGEGLDVLFPASVKKIPLPKSALKGAKKFLELSGVNEYTLFPDLDGLSRWLCAFHQL